MAAPKLYGKDLRYRNRDWLYARYIDDQMSAYEIGRLVGAKHNTIGEWLSIHGIPKRRGRAVYATKRSRQKRQGTKNPNWRGGEYQSGDGRIYIFQPDHPSAWVTGYVARARLVVEKKLGRYLQEDEAVHHINHRVEDDRPENLIPLLRSEHSRLHAKERIKECNFRANFCPPKINPNIA